MKIRTRILTTFLKKVMMTKSQIINECLFNFSPEGLRVNAANEAQLCRVTSLLKKESFKEYESIGSIAIGDLINVIRIIDRFNDEITIKVEGNLLTISQAGKKVEIELLDKEFIKSSDKELNLKFDDAFSFPSDKLHEILDDVKLNDDSKIRIITEANKLKIVNTGKYKFSHEFITTCKGGVVVQFGQPLLHAVTELNGNLDFSIKTDYPIQIKEVTEDSEITLIVAPLVESE